MGKSYRDANRRAHKSELKQEKNLARLLAAREDDDFSDGSAGPDTPSRRSRKESLAVSRATSRTVSRAASPFSADRISADLDDSSFPSPLRFSLGSSRSSRHTSAVQSPAESDLETDRLGSLDGDELLTRISQILSSKTSVRGADHKMKKAAGRSSKRSRQDARDGTSASSRKEDVLTRLCDFLHEDVFHTNVVDDHVHDMHHSILISIKQPGSPAERNLALRAFAMVAVTSGANESSLSSTSVLKEIIGAGTDENTQVLAIYALTAVICFGDSGLADRDKLLKYLLEIVQTDGESVNAHDSPLVVGAAMEAWAFVATSCELHEHSVDAMEAFSEQLESADSNVQVLAASNIALMFDISRQLRANAENEAEPGQEPDATSILDLYEDPKRIAQRIRRIARERSPIRSKQNRSTWKEQLQYAAVSLELDVGYGYSVDTVGGPRGAQWYLGYSETLDVNERKLLVKSWAVWFRVRFLQNILGNGFANHFDENSKVQYYLEDAPVLGLNQGWDHEPQESEAATLVMNYWENGQIPEELEDKT